MFEVIAPPITWGVEKVENWVLKVSKILNNNKISYLSLPEVVNETTRRETRTVSFTPKIDNIYFSELVKKYVGKVIPVPNKICVIKEKRDFMGWVEKVHKNGIRHITIVGGESSKIKYPGYSVLEAGGFIHRRFPDIKLGCITIFTRKGEEERIIAKMKNGIEFFVSQIIFQTANIKHVIINLLNLLEKEKLPLPEIYISLAPALKVKDIEFMKWLGVEFPSAILSYLIDKEKEVERRTFEILNRLIDEIFDFMDKQKIKLSFNIEHVMYGNLKPAEKILVEIKRRI